MLRPRVVLFSSHGLVALFVLSALGGCESQADSSGIAFSCTPGEQQCATGYSCQYDPSRGEHICIAEGSAPISEDANLDASDTSGSTDTTPDPSDAQFDSNEADATETSEPCDADRAELEPFKIIYDTQYTGSNDAVIDPGSDYGNIPYDIDVGGDGTYEMKCVTGEQTLSFPSPGRHIVQLRGMPRFSIAEDDAPGLVEVSQWGEHTWLSMQAAFRNCTNLELTADDEPNLALVRDMSRMFEGAERVDCTEDQTSLTDWNTTSVENLRRTFRGAVAFDCPLDNWDVSNVTDLSETFYGAKSFNQSLAGWDVSNVTVMEQAFMFAEAFNGDVSSWDTSSVTNFHEMFRGASSFNQSLDNWNIGSVNAVPNESMSGMLRGTSMSRENYDQTLQGWACADRVPQDVTLGANDIRFCYEWIRDQLVQNHGWSIDGDVQDTASCTGVSVPRSCE